MLCNGIPNSPFKLTTGYCWNVSDCVPENGELSELSRWAACNILQYKWKGYSCARNVLFSFCSSKSPERVGQSENHPRATPHVLVCGHISCVLPRLCNTIRRAYAPFIMTVKRTKAILYGELHSLCMLYPMDTTLQEGCVFWGFNV
jgi:hypothetical protein